MIVRPDGTLEGTPEELASYQKLMNQQVAPFTIPLQPYPQPWPGDTGTPWWLYPTICTTDSSITWPKEKEVISYV